jgi:hypothetical protein
MKLRIFLPVIAFLFITGVVSGASAPDAVLILHFDEGSGTVVHDSSGNGYDGTIHGAQWVDGISGKALSFNGQSNYIDLGSPDLSISQGTIEAWIYPRSVRCCEQIFSIRDSSLKNNLQFYLSTGSTVNYYSAVNGERKIGLSSDISANNWYHVVVTQDGAACKLYVNGQLKATSPDGEWFDDVIGGNEFAVGRLNYMSNYYFDGIIDEFSIYPKALTFDEIQSLYAAKKAGTSTLKTSSTTLSQPWVTQAGTGKYTVKAEGVVIPQQQQDSQTTIPQKDTEDFLSKNLIIIIIVLGCVSITSVIIVLKKKDSQKIPQNVIAVPDPIPSVQSSQQVHVQPIRPSPRPTPPVTPHSGPQVSKVMNDFPRRNLKDIIGKYGSNIINEPLKVKGLLLDYCADSESVGITNFQKEIHLLGLALSQNIPQDLLNTSQNEPFEFKRIRLQKRLTDLAVEEQAARWAIEAWAEALGKS